MNSEIEFAPADGRKRGNKDTKEKKGRHFNLLDAFILIVIAAAAALIIMVYFPTGLIGSWRNRTMLVYTVEIEGVPSDFASRISIGDTVVDSNGYAMGSVASEVEVEAFTVISYDRDTGEVVSSDHPQLSDLLVTIRVNAAADDKNGYSSDGQRIAVGAEYKLVFPGFEGVGKCISLAEERTAEGGA